MCVFKETKITMFLNPSQVQTSARGSDFKLGSWAFWTIEWSNARDRRGSRKNFNISQFYHLSHFNSICCRSFIQIIWIITNKSTTKEHFTTLTWIFDENKAHENEFWLHLITSKRIFQSVFHSLSLHSKCILVLGIFHRKCKDAHINFYRLKLLVLQTNKNTDQPSTRAESADSNLLKWFFLKEIEFCALERFGRPRVTCFHQQEDGIKCRRYHLCSEWKCEQTANFPVHLSLLNLTMELSD